MHFIKPCQGFYSRKQYGCRPTFEHGNYFKYKEFYDEQVHLWRANQVWKTSAKWRTISGTWWFKELHSSLTCVWGVNIDRHYWQPPLSDAAPHNTLYKLSAKGIPFRCERGLLSAFSTRRYVPKDPWFSDRRAFSWPVSTCLHLHGQSMKSSIVANGLLWMSDRTMVRLAQWHYLLDPLFLYWLQNNLKYWTPFSGVSQILLTIPMSAIHAPGQIHNTSKSQKDYLLSYLS